MNQYISLKLWYAKIKYLFWLLQSYTYSHVHKINTIQITIKNYRQVELPLKMEIYWLIELYSVWNDFRFSLGVYWYKYNILLQDSSTKHYFVKTINLDTLKYKLKKIAVGDERWNWKYNNIIILNQKITRFKVGFNVTRRIEWIVYFKIIYFVFWLK